MRLAVLAQRGKAVLEGVELGSAIHDEILYYYAVISSFDLYNKSAQASYFESPFTQQAQQVEHNKGNKPAGSAKLLFHIIMMNSKINRQIKTKKSSVLKGEDQPLKGETSKIQSKLEALKAQVAMRKTMKNKQKQTEKSSLAASQRNSTGESWARLTKGSQSKLNWQGSDKLNKILVTSQKPALTSQKCEDQEKLDSLLKQLNMEAFRETITGKYQVNGLQKLLQLTEEDINEWKSIPVGFRVKLRKFINEHAKNKDSVQSKQEGAKDEEGIQAIIKRRKTERVYEPICDKQLQEEQVEQIQIEETDKQGNPKIEGNEERDEEDILISSLNSAFLQRRGIIKKSGSCSSINSSNSKNKVRWDSSVVEYNKQSSNFQTEKLMTKYPNSKGGKNSVANRSETAWSYCWQCLGRINKIEQEQQFEEYDEEAHRTFCNNKCRSKYHKATQQKSELIKQAEEQLEGGNEGNGADSNEYELDLQLL